VHVLEVQQGLCDVVLEAEHQRQQALEGGDEQRGDSAEASAKVFGVVFTHEDPETLRHLSDFDDLDVVALEGCEKAARTGEACCRPVAIGCCALMPRVAFQASSCVWCKDSKALSTSYSLYHMYIYKYYIICILCYIYCVMLWVVQG